MRALPGIIPFDHRCKAEAEDPAATVFELKPLTSMEFMRVAEMRRYSNAQATELTLRYGLRGWRNLAGPSGEVKFDRDDLEGSLARLGFDVQQELAEAIVHASQVSEATRKN